MSEIALNMYVNKEVGTMEQSLWDYIADLITSGYEISISKDCILFNPSDLLIKMHKGKFWMVQKLSIALLKQTKNSPENIIKAYLEKMAHDIYVAETKRDEDD